MRVLALVALVACGSPHHGSDATPGDDGPGGGDSGGDDGSNAMIDAPPPDVPNVRGTVKMTVTNASVALCNLAQLHVVFIDVDSTVTDLIADASGKAQADVFPGASVTAVCERTTGTTEMAVTVQDVEPGDDITLDGSYFFNGSKTADQTAAGTFTVHYPADAGAAGYDIYGPCGNAAGAGGSATLSMKAGCVLSSMDLLVVARNNMGAPLAWAEAPNVAYVNSGNVTVTDTWHPFVSITASYTNAPAFCADSNDPDYPCVAQLARYVPELHGLRASAMTNVSTSGVVSVSAATSSSALMQTQLSTTGPEYQIFTDVVDGSQTAYGLDFAVKALPWMCRNTAQCPMFSDIDAKLTIPVTGSGSYDLFEADATYTRGQQILIWRVFGPTAGDVTFPVLPTSVASVRPQPGDRQSGTHSRICESDVLNGWRDARQNPFDSLATCTQSTNPTSPRYSGSRNRLSASQ